MSITDTAGGAKRVPALRFPEFEGEWDEKRLGLFFEEYKEKSVEQDQHEVLTSARSGLVRQKDYYDNDRITDRDNIGFNIIPPEYLTYRSRSDDRRFFFNENRLGVTGIISIYYPVFKIVDGNNKFFAELLATHSNYIGKFSVGTSQTVLSMTELKRIKLPLPKAPEQKKIAAFLGVVDAKIAALRDRRAGLERYKRGLMQALFSQTLRFTKPDGSAFPDWEEKQADDLFASVSNKKHNGELPILAITQEGGAVLRDEIDIDIKATAASVMSYKVVESGDFIISLRSFQGGIEYSRVLGICSPAYTILKPQHPISDGFFQSFFKDADFISRLSATVVGIRDGKQISYSAFATLRLPYPHHDEQAKIADALSAMDAKIAAVGDQVAKMEAFKKGLLQQMFV